jgi:amino acid adenylation domain-containing protein
MIIHEQFEQQVARTPDAVALISGERRLTYAAVNQAANRLARWLLGRGVRREEFVGIQLERSIDAVVAILGILKAGAAWIYLEPDLPRLRLDAILKDAQPRVVIGQDILPGDLNREDASAANPEVAVLPDDAACLLYTSGSTGQPKGAVEIHRSLTARLESNHLPDINAHDVCALNSSLAFGVTPSRLLLPLALGAKVVILAEDEAKDLLRFANVLAVHMVTSLFLPPVLLRALLQLDGSMLARLSAIRAVSLTGSSITPELVRAFFAAFPRASLVNLYGSTEIGTTAALRVMTSSLDADMISIGHPLPTAAMYILDENMQPVADGEIGELYVGTPYLAREYLNQPNLTAERFLPDPGVSGERVYRTGDLARRLSDGAIQLCGRRDYQVKIRGHRIELGEIEVVLESHRGVKEAVVTVNNELLIAQVVRKPGVNPTVSELRAYVQERLPQAMHPATYRFLPGLPRTAGGKVDRMRLPPYDPARPEVDPPFEAPHNGMETGVAEIWAEALRIRQIGIHDNFLDLGGDSLAAIRVIVQLEQRFGFQLAMDVLFERTIASIASDIRGWRSHSSTG